MKKSILLGSALVATITFAAPSMAKTLVYCSEASPEGFTPALYTGGTTFDASSRQVFNKLVELERGDNQDQSWSGGKLGRF